MEPQMLSQIMQRVSNEMDGVKDSLRSKNSDRSNVVLLALEHLLNSHQWYHSELPGQYIIIFIAPVQLAAASKVRS